MSNKDEELVLCIPNVFLEEHTEMETGFSTETLPLDLLVPVFVKRGVCETHEGFQQIIPYIIVWRENEKHKEVLTYRRTKVTGDSRLKKKKSIGFGGHINPKDATNAKSVSDYVAHSAARELFEELGIEVDDTIAHVVGSVSNNDDAVGRVHLGVVITAEVPSTAKLDYGKDNSICDVEWKRWDYLLEEDAEDYERWSQLILDQDDECELLDFIMEGVHLFGNAKPNSNREVPDDVIWRHHQNDVTGTYMLTAIPAADDNIPKGRYVVLRLDDPDEFVADAAKSAALAYAKEIRPHNKKCESQSHNIKTTIAVINEANPPKFQRSPRGSNKEQGERSTG